MKTKKLAVIIFIILMTTTIFSITIFYKHSNHTTNMTLLNQTPQLNNPPKLLNNSESTQLGTDFTQPSKISPNITYSVKKIDNNTYIVNLTIPIENSKNNEKIIIDSDFQPYYLQTLL